MIRLTDEEIPYKPENENTEFYGDFGLLRRDLYRDGATAQLKKVGEWGDEECEEHGFRLEGEDEDSLGIVYPKRRECSKCWQAVKE